jgi:prepilin-type processing-associated H-X9-DG protein
MYADEHDGRYPLAWEGAPVNLRWNDRLLPYLSSTNVGGGKGVLVCPSAKFTPSGLPVSALVDHCAYKKNQWGMELAARYDSEVILAYDGIPNDLAASDNDELATVNCYIDERHRNSANFLFGDIHVGSMTSTSSNNWVLK